MSIPGELVKNANSQAHLDLLRQELQGGVRHWVLPSLQVMLVFVQVRETLGDIRWVPQPLALSWAWASGESSPFCFLSL